MNKQAQLSLGLIISAIIVLIVIVAIAIPLISGSVNIAGAGSNVTSTVNVVLSNTNGTVNATGANVYIDNYVNTNYTIYNTVSKANFTANVPSTDYVKLLVNGVATTSNFKLGSVVNDSYPINDSKSSYKITAYSNASGIKNVTEYLLISPTTKTIVTTVKPNAMTMTVLDFIIVFLALAALVVGIKYLIG